MANQVVQMDYEAIQGVAKGFYAAEQVVKAVAQIVIAILEAWKQVPFVGWALSAYYTQWQENIREKADALENLLHTMADNLLKAIGDHQKGDVAGKQYFMQGITNV